MHWTGHGVTVSRPAPGAKHESECGGWELQAAVAGAIDDAMHPPPVALTVAGSDCSSGAGLQADLKTFQHFGVHGLTAVTCVVSETANVVRAVHPVPVGLVADQMTLMLESFPVRVMKTGMLFSAAHVAAVAEIAARHRDVMLVVDPVMIASTGDPLLEADAVELYRTRLLPLARVITPNLPEAEELLGRRIAGAGDLEAAARELAERFDTAVLLKGGHLDGPLCTDVLIDGGDCHFFETRRIEVAGSHGTGCTLSAAVAARLALGDSLPAAVDRSKYYLQKALEASYTFAGAAGAVHALNQGTCGD